jgi:hypothetical protein
VTIPQVDVLVRITNITILFLRFWWQFRSLTSSSASPLSPSSSSDSGDNSAGWHLRQHHHYHLPLTQILVSIP